MGHRETIRSNDMEFLEDRAVGEDDPIYKTRKNNYTMTLKRGSKAKILDYGIVWYEMYKPGNWVCVTNREQVVWPAYSLEYEGQGDRAKADALGMSVDEIQNIITTRLIKKIHGEAVDPTLYLLELDRNFAMVAKRANQGLEFLKNLKNPKKLAQLTLSFFKGKETRRTLTKRYARAKRQYWRRAKRWKTKDWSSSFLEYQFGWRPLCEDTWKLIGLAREAKRRQAQHKAVAGLQPLVETASWSKAGPVGLATDMGYAKATMGGHGKIYFEITNPWLRAGASLEPPSYSAWDNIPYSWLADCVTNVGQHLKYALYDSGLGFIGGYVTTFKKTTCSVAIDTSPQWNYGDGWKAVTGHKIASGALTYEGVTNRRRRYTEFPAVPWFNRVENTLKNTELLVTIGAFLHQAIANLADGSRWYHAVP